MNIIKKAWTDAWEQEKKDQLRKSEEQLILQAFKNGLYLGATAATITIAAVYTIWINTR